MIEISIGIAAAVVTVTLFGLVTEAIGIVKEYLA